MKKVVVSLILSIMLVSLTGFVFADNNESDINNTDTNTTNSSGGWGGGTECTKYYQCNNAVRVHECYWKNVNSGNGMKVECVCEENPESLCPGNVIGGQTDEHSCLTGAGYSWNESEQKCVREWEHGKERYQEQIKERNKSNVTFVPWQKRNESECPDGCKCVGAVVKCNTATGKIMTITTGSGKIITITVDKTNVTTELEVEQEAVEGNQTKIRTKLKNGKTFEIKVMPDSAAERALERLRLKVCNESNNCSIQLKESGNGNQTRATYEIQIQRHSKILGIFKAKLQSRVQVDADNGNVINVKKPWWAFIASEPEE